MACQRKTEPASANAAAAEASVFERLENRRLLSQITVTNFGAVPNDGHDDTGAIQAAVNASGNGDTVFFPRGTYNLSNEIRLKGGNRTYRGEDGTTIKGADSWHIFHVLENDTKIENFTLDGKPVMIDQWARQMVNNVVVNNNVMEIHGSGDNVNGVTFTTGLTNSQITNNRFENSGGMGVYGYYWNNLRIANNEFVHLQQGMHLDNINNQGQNLMIEQNYFSDIRRIGVEYQGGGNNTILQDNYYENPVLSNTKNENDEVYAFSVIADRSNGTIARRNTVIAPQRPDGWGVRLGFEIGGDNALVEQNYIVGTQYCVSGNDYFGSSSVTVRDNHVENTLNGPFGRLSSKSNNGPGVQLNWNSNRGKPGRNHSFGGSNPAPAPQPTPAPAPPPTPAPPPAPAPAPAPAPTPAPAPAPAPAPQPTNPQPEPTPTPDQPAGPVVLGPVLPSAVTQDPSTLHPSDQPFVYLTHFKALSASNGLGPVEVNRSNGDETRRDGDRITLDGKMYDRGLGVAGNSEVVYKLNGKFARFFSDIGLDDSRGTGGSVTFRVFADGKKIFDSGVIAGDDATMGVSLKVRGVKELKLVTTDAGDNADADIADWAGARLVPVIRPPVELTPASLVASARPKFKKPAEDGAV